MEKGDLVNCASNVYIIELIILDEYTEKPVLCLRGRDNSTISMSAEDCELIKVPDMYIEKKTPVRFQFSGAVGQLYEALETLDIKELLVEFLFNSKEYYADKGMDYFESWLIDKGFLSDFSQDELLVDFGYELPF